MLTSRQSRPVIKKPEMTKNTSKPTNPPLTPGISAWNRTTATTATARKPSMSGRNSLCNLSALPATPAAGLTLSAWTKATYSVRGHVRRVEALSHTCPTSWYVVGSGACGSRAHNGPTEAAGAVWLAGRVGLPIESGGEPVVVIEAPTLDRTNLHRIWKAVLIGIALVVATACYFAPVLLIVIGLLLLFLLCVRFVYPGRDRYIPNLYARDIRVYDDAYRTFIGRTLSDLRRCRIRGHTLLWEASRLPLLSRQDPDELLLDLGVWIGWSTRLVSDACDRKVYGFDTF